MLSLVFLVYWVRSVRWANDGWGLESPMGASRRVGGHLSSWGGRLTFEGWLRAENPGAPQNARSFDHRVGPPTRDSAAFANYLRYLDDRGAWRIGNVGLLIERTDANVFAPGRGRAPPRPQTVVSFMMPHWLPMVVMFVPPLAWLVRRWRRDRSALPCAACGYDLRCTPRFSHSCCPECGEPLLQATDTAESGRGL